MARFVFIGLVGGVFGRFSVFFIIVHLPSAWSLRILKVIRSSRTSGSILIKIRENSAMRDLNQNFWVVGFKSDGCEVVGPIQRGICASHTRFLTDIIHFNQEKLKQQKTCHFIFLYFRLCNELRPPCRHRPLREVFALIVVIFLFANSKLYFFS